MSDELRGTIRFSKCSGISRGEVISRKKLSHGHGNFLRNESALTPKDSTQRFTRTMKKRLRRGENSYLLKKFTDAAKMRIIGSWEIQGLADHAARFITTGARNILAVNLHAESVAIVIDTWKSGT